MKYSPDEIQKLLTKAGASINKTAQLQQVIAQIEACLSRTENQKVTEKSNEIISVSRSFKPWILIYVSWKPPINKYRD